MAKNSDAEMKRGYYHLHTIDDYIWAKNWRPQGASVGFLPSVEEVAINFLHPHTRY